MQKTIFSKYNTSRLPRFRTLTLIHQDLSTGKKHVVKSAIDNDAKIHIRNMFNNYELLTDKFPDATFVKPYEIGDNEIVFDYIDGESILTKCIKAVLDNNRKDLLNILEQVRSYVDIFVVDKVDCFSPCEAFNNIFGEVSIVGNQDIIIPCNIDIILSNLLVIDDNKIVQIDYEWVYDFPIMKDFITWRMLFELGILLQNVQFIDINEVYSFFNINLNNINQFQAMEDHFQRYVSVSKEIKSPEACLYDCNLHPITFLQTIEYRIEHYDYLQQEKSALIETNKSLQQEKIRLMEINQSNVVLIDDIKHQMHILLTTVENQKQCILEISEDLLLYKPKLRYFAWLVRKLNTVVNKIERLIR